MLHLISLRFVDSRKLSQMIRSAANIKCFALIMEVVLLFWELDLIYSENLANLEQEPVKSRVKRTLVFSLARRFDLLRAAGMFSPALNWAVLSLLCLLGALFAVQLQTKHHSVPYLQLSSVRRYSLNLAETMITLVLYSYSYVFYAVTILSTGFLACQEHLIVTEQSVEPLGIQIEALYANSLESSSLSTRELRWKADPSVKCFALEYNLMLFPVCAIAVLNLHFKLLHDQLTSLYPNPIIFDCPRNGSYSLQYLYFFFLFFTRFVVTSVGDGAWLDSYHYCSIGLFVIGLLTTVAARPYLNGHLLAVKLAKNAVVLSSAVYLLLVRKFDIESSVSHYSPMTGSFFVISLASAGLFKVLQQSAFQDPLISQMKRRTIVYDERTPLSIPWMRELVYEIESTKLREKAELIQGNQYHQIPTALFHTTHSLACHSAACTKPFCYCHDRTLFLKSNLLFGLVQRVNLDWLLTAVLLASDMMHTQIKFFTAFRASQRGSAYLEFIKLWSVWSLSNFGNTREVIVALQALSKEESDKHHRGKLRKAEKKVIEALKMLIQKTIEEFEEKRSADASWEPLMSNEARPSLQDLGKETRLDLRRVSFFIENFNKFKISLGSAFKMKKEFLGSLTEPAASLLQASEAFTCTCLKVQHVLAKLARTEFVVHLRTSILELYFLSFIKEDIQSANNKVRHLYSKLLEDNLLLIFEVDPKRIVKKEPGVVVGVSGEQPSFHKIIYSFGNLDSLGYQESEVLGADLEKLLPNVVSDFHKDILSAPFELNHSVQRMGWLQTFIKCRDEYIRPAAVTYRMQASVNRGLEYLGAISFEELKSDKLLQVLVDQDGIIRDCCAYSGRVFSIGDPIEQYNESLSAYVIWNSKKIQLEQLGYQEVKKQRCDFEEEAFKQHMFELLEASSGIMEDWYPVTISHREAEERLDMNANVKCFVNYPSKRLYYLVQFDQLDYKDRNNGNPVELMSKFILASRSIFKKDSAIPSEQGMELQPANASGFNITSRLKSLLSSNSKEGSKFDFSSKYAQQTIEVQLPELNIPSIRSQKKIMTKKRISKIMGPKQEKFMFPFIATVMLKSENQIEEKTEQSHKQKNPIDIVKEKFKIESHSSNSSKLKHSRFIHHNINFKGINRLTALFVLPVILLMSSMAAIYAIESVEMLRLEGIYHHGLALHMLTHAKMHCHRYLALIDVRRMVVDGLLLERSLSKFGVESLTPHLISLAAHSNQQFGILDGYLKMNLHLDKSDLEVSHESQDIQTMAIKEYLQGEERNFEERRVEDAIKIIEQQLTFFFSDLATRVSPEGSGVDDLSNRKLEEAARYNVQNTLMGYFENSKRTLTSGAIYLG